MKLERIPWNEAGPPREQVLKERLDADGFDAFVWQDAPGSDYQPHAHDHDESLWVLDGEIVFGASGAEYRLGPGDRLMLPKGTVHTARTSRGATYLIGQRR
jgi:quercetin dioxygenase-like cupin family protein